MLENKSVYKFSAKVNNIFGLIKQKTVIYTIITTLQGNN